MPYRKPRPKVAKLANPLLTGATTTPSGTTYVTTSSISLTSAQLNDLTVAGVNNPNIPFASLAEMINFILYSNPANTSSLSLFETWETMIISIDTTTNGTFSMNTAFVDPAGLREYIPFSQVKLLMKQFWTANSLYVTNMQLKFRLPKNYITSGSSQINQAAIDPTGDYSQFNVAFTYTNGSAFAVPTAVEAVSNPSVQPLQLWYQTLNNMIINWRIASVNANAGNLTTNSLTTTTTNLAPTANLSKPPLRPHRKR